MKNPIDVYEDTIKISTQLEITCIATDMREKFVKRAQCTG